MSATSSRKRHLLRDRPEAVLGPLVLALVCFGLVMVYSASSAPAILSQGNPLQTVTRQAVYAVVGCGAFFLALRMRQAAFRRIAPLAVGASLVLLLMVLVPGIGVSANGARRWLDAGVFQLQPSELAKVALALWIAGAIAREPKRLTARGGLMPFLLLTGVLAVLIVIEPDLGTALAMVAMAFAMLLVGGAHLRRLGAAVAGGLGLVIVAIAIEPYRVQRLISFVDPWSDPEGAGFQVVQAQVALGSGGAFGVGLGNGIQKANYLPEAHTDMILATVGEELGLFGVGLVLCAFGLFALLGYRIALRARDLHGQVLAAGLTTLVVAQGIVNMGAVLGFLPVTGVPLPFISFGGSSLIISLFSVGVLVNIGRGARPATARLTAVDGERARSGADRRGRNRGARDAGARGGRRAVGARG